MLAITCDVSIPEQVRAAVAQALKAFGRIDCAFNNAGHEIAQMVRQGGGVVVNTSSGAGIRGVAGGASYAASKHGMIGMTKSAALDYAKQNIRVNCVLPGNIATPMMNRFTGGDIQKAIDLEPVGRLGKPEEIAEAVLWMCSDLGGFVTGASIVVDGGWSH